MQARPVRPSRRQLCLWLRFFLFIALAVARVPAANDPFAENIRKTEPLTPEQEQKAFHLPPGFEIQLVAAEPDIGKVMNMAFDARGQLWVTQSREYPYAATNQPYRDQIKNLSDFDANGRAKKITTFARGLNIPIGLLPYRDGVIAFSIPNIYYFADTNRDGRADTKELVMGRIGFEKDTHGLTSSFRRGYDGWIYADHGFNNDSTLTAKSGEPVKLNSGNTYRFQPDGSRVEQFTHGQVNPFGLMFDPLGDLWSADCHSSPVYLLLRGAYYPSFGKAHDGLGFAPNVCDHSHGSTAIAGMVYYAATNFPPEFRGNTFVGNVMTCRINRDSYLEHGSTRLAKAEPDFLRCDDPWFRPVDLQLGPDGALYVADFYNRIIGHYEVPLDNPGRDRERGRIWRIVYCGANVAQTRKPAAKNPDLARASASELIKQLTSPNLAVRMLAMNQLVDRIGQPAVRPVEKMLQAKKSTPEQKAHGLWVLHRLGALKPEILAAAARDADRTVRVHAMRIISESHRAEGFLRLDERPLVFGALQDPDAYVQRAAADALGEHTHGTEHGDYVPILSLLELRRRIPAADAELLYVCRMALRNHLRLLGTFPYLESLDLSESDSKAVADVAVGIPGDESAAFLLKHVQKFSENRERLTTYLRHTVRYAPEAQLNDLGRFVREKFSDDPDFQFTLFKAAQDGVAQRGAKLTDDLREWAGALAEKLLLSVNETNVPWISLPLKGAAVAGNPWVLDKRKSADSDAVFVFLSSYTPGGESLTGILRSRPFAIPPQLSFFLAGHDGSPDKPPRKKNVVRLLAAGTREVLARAEPPRDDTAQRVSWDLSAHAGRQGFLEIVDGNAGRSFAWLAAGRFDPPVVPLPEVIPNQACQRQQNAAELARTVLLPQFEPQMVKLLGDEDTVPQVRAAAAQALAALNLQAYVPLLVKDLADTNQPPTLREDLAALLAELNSPAARDAALGAIREAPQRLQVKLALSLAGSAAGADALLTLVERRQLSPQILNDRAVKERLVSTKLSQVNERYARLTNGLPSVTAKLQKLIDDRRTGFDADLASAERGHALFEKTCAVCHQIDGKGAVVGPQLDGVGNRGLERIIEDVLDPNRNIDPAFRPSLVTLKDDTSITGLQRREEGEVLVFVDTLGKEISVPKKEIAERRESQLSLMPSNFGEALTADEFNDLLAFLLAHGATNLR